MKCHFVLKRTTMVTFGTSNRSLSSGVKGQGKGIYRVSFNIMLVCQDLILKIILRNVMKI